jgi:hypothetical protein
MTDIIKKDTDSKIEFYTTVHYAIQTCDIVLTNTDPKDKPHPRYCSDDKGEILQKSLTSFFTSLEYCVWAAPKVHHYIKIFDDHSSDRTLGYFERLIKRFACDNIHIEIHHLEGRGIMNSTRECYTWMDQEGKELVYQIQDDFLWHKNCIFEMIDIFNQTMQETTNHLLIFPNNEPWPWHGFYRYKLVPRMLVPGAFRYWVSTYDVPSGFMTSVTEFRKHWDLYEKYFALPPYHPELETLSLNKILCESRTYGIKPVDSMAFHLQYAPNKEPYMDWKTYWDAVEEI